LEDLLALSERRREKDLKVILTLSECRRERDLKDLLAPSERRQEQIKRPLCVGELRRDESSQCIRGGGDVAPGQVEASGKVLLTLE